MNRLVWAVSLAVLLSACSSAVKLDSVPVEDRMVSPAFPPATDVKAAAGTSAVASVDISQANQDAAMKAAGRTVYFDYDSFTLKPEAQAVIDTHARILKGDKSKKIAIEGHTDERGGREYNLALGQKRAEAVRRALALLGASDLQMEAVSFGEEKPAVVGSTEAAMEKNRRAEISYR